MTFAWLLKYFEIWQIMIWVEFFRPQVHCDVIVSFNLFGALLLSCSNALMIVHSCSFIGWFENFGRHSEATFTSRDEKAMGCFGNRALIRILCQNRSPPEFTALWKTKPSSRHNFFVLSQTLLTNTRLSHLNLNTCLCQRETNKPSLTLCSHFFKSCRQFVPERDVSRVPRVSD